MTQVLDQLASDLGVTWFDYQVAAFEGWQNQADDKACLYFKTGAGKSITSLVMMSLRTEKDVLVVAPPSTHATWQEVARKVGLPIETISHAKFRMASYKLSRHTPVIVDEFHMLGGHTGKGWTKLDRLSRGLQAPLIICSATPSYNDAERCYCVAHVLDARAHNGGYLDWLYRHCNTEQNPFGMTPLLNEQRPFQKFKDAVEFLAALPGVYYLADDLVYQIQDVSFYTPLPAEMWTHGYNRREHRMIASGMERRHTETFQLLVNEDGMIHDHVMDQVIDLIRTSSGPVMVYANHATVAVALAGTLQEARPKVPFALVTGGMTTKNKEQEISRFKRKEIPVLIGTASLATGTDGLDKMCDTLIILDDTDDDSLRRQLIGRIMPRGADTDVSKKRVFRLLSV